MLKRISVSIGQLLVKYGIGMRTKMIAVFLTVHIFSMVIFAVFAWRQFTGVSSTVIKRAAEDAAYSIDSRGRETLENAAADIAVELADFLYERDRDIAFLASIPPSEGEYRRFASVQTKSIQDTGVWVLSDALDAWERVVRPVGQTDAASPDISDDRLTAVHARPDRSMPASSFPLYDEITFVDLDGMERIKIVSPSTKRRFPISKELRDISRKRNTYIGSEEYFDELKRLSPGEIYVSGVVGAYTPSDVVGMYTPKAVEEAARASGVSLDYAPEAQAYARGENPKGRKFEGIIRWASPVADASGEKIGYVTLALDYAHVIEIVSSRSIRNEGDYDMCLWDPKCRNIVSRRHSEMTGYDPSTGWPLGPDPASSDDPRRDGWMALTNGGGTGSFYVQHGEARSLSAAAAVPYYTGQYAPSPENGMTRRGFGIVTADIGEDMFASDVEWVEGLIRDDMDSQIDPVFRRLVLTSSVLTAIVCLMAFIIATWIMLRIAKILRGVVRLRNGELHARLHEPVKDEFGMISDAFDAMADGIRDNYKNPLTIIDRDMRVVHMNDHALRFCGLSIDEVIGRHYSEVSVFPKDTAYDPVAALEAGVEASAYYLEPLDVYLRPMAAHFIDIYGEHNGYIIESIDVTENQKMQLELERATDAANEASQHKSDFLARMSHEIRTPMNAIIGIAGIIHRRIDPVPEGDETLKYIADQIGMIETSSHHLLSLLNDVLDISKIDSGKIDLVNEDMPMEKLTEAIDSVIAPRCAEEGLSYVKDHYDFRGDTFICDSLRLRQALINILGNAVKFTPRGGTITFKIDKTEETAERARLRFVVSDTGVGMDAATAARVFAPFEQADKGMARRYGGAGLGLPISSSIVKLFGGEIEVESEVCKGSVFSFEIWLDKSKAVTNEALSIDDLSGKLEGKRVLLVDDVDINRMIVATMLEDTGAEVDEAEDGRVALEMFARSEIGGYSLIFMDIQMPNMDGYEASMAIRALERADASSVPIVALTANAYRDDVQKALDSGMDAHIAKPVEESPICDALMKFVLERAS